jgi:hypothetical protein
MEQAIKTEEAVWTITEAVRFTGASLTTSRLLLDTLQKCGAKVRKRRAVINAHMRTKVRATSEVKVYRFDEEVFEKAKLENKRLEGKSWQDILAVPVEKRIFTE